MVGEHPIAPQPDTMRYLGFNHDSPKSLDDLVAFVIASLPDSLDARRRLLQTLSNTLPIHYPGRVHILEIVHSLEHHDQLQRNLPLNLLNGRH